MTQVPNGVDPHDWVTIWQSEWAAMAVDRELLEGLMTATQIWNTARDSRVNEPSGRPGADAPPGAAPVGDAPRPGRRNDGNGGDGSGGAAGGTTEPGAAIR